MVRFEVKKRNLTSFVVAVFLSVCCYNIFSQEIITPKEGENIYEVFISKQDSDFKNEVVEELKLNFKNINFKVTMLSELKELNVDEWDAIIILHSWEFLSPPRSVKRFIRDNTTSKSKIIVLTTSSDGDSKMDEVDAITGESELVDAYEYAHLITQRLNKIFAKPN